MNETLDELMTEIVNGLDAGDDGPVYGNKIMYGTYDERPDLTMLMPWLTYSKHRAHHMKNRLRAKDQEPLLMRLFHTAFPDEHQTFVPIAVKIVRLAEIPF